MTRIPHWRRAALLALSMAAISLIALSFACGGDDDSGGDGTVAATTPAAATPTGDGSGDGESVILDVSMDELAGVNIFKPTVFTVPSGAEVTFNITNDGTAIHNMRIAGADGVYNNGDDAVSDPDFVSGGSEATLEWTAPGEPGEIAFRCDLHPTDMLGTITVE